MCVIIVKEKNGQLPKVDDLKNCFARNDDGSGFMYTSNNKVIIDKGYMTEKSFIKRFNYLCKRYDNFKNKSLVIHCRIGTAGSNTPQNTHPYPITSSINKLHKKYTTCSLGVAHNGIISSYNPSKDDEHDTNDTQQFIIKVLKTLKDNVNEFLKNDNIKDLISKISNSRFAFLNNKDEVYMIGDFIEHEGCYYSNTSYLKQTYYGYSNSAYSSEYWNNYWDEYNKRYDYKETYKDDDLYTKEYEDDYLEPVPQSYNIEYGDNWAKGTDGYFYVNTLTGKLYRYNFHKNDYEYLSDTFTLYNENYDVIDDYVNGCVTCY